MEFLKKFSGWIFHKFREKLELLRRGQVLALIRELRDKFFSKRVNTGVGRKGMFIGILGRNKV